MTPEQQAEYDEVWKPVVGYEGIYEVSNQGRIRALLVACRGRHKSGRILKPKSTQSGYLIVGLHRYGSAIKYSTIHKLVLEAFVGPRPEGKETRHLNDVKSDNRLSNLVWGTRLENIEDKKANGKIPHGENSNRSKLKNEDVLRIRKLWDAGLSARAISNQFNICVMAAWRIGARKAWNHLPEAS